MLYHINEEAFELFEKKIKKIIRKCNNYGCNFTYNIVGEEIIQEENSNIYNKFYIVDMNGVAKIKDWKFVAIIEHCDKGNVIRRYDMNTTLIPERYYKTPPYCEHCKTNRRRNDTYLIYNTKTTEFKQVGRNCLADYTNGLDMELVKTVVDMMDELEYCDMRFGYAKKYFNISSFLCNCYELTKHFGYTSKGKGKESGAIPTSVFALDILNNSLSKTEYKKLLNIPHYKNKCYSQENIEFVTKALTWILSKNTSIYEDEFLYNLKTICGNSHISERDLGYVASLISVYMREVKANEKKWNHENTTQFASYYGEVGKKICVNVSVKMINKFDGMYGISYLYKMIDAKNRVFIWFTSKEIEDCESVRLRGTVKEHKLYNDEYQTILTRCSMERI